MSKSSSFLRGIVVVVFVGLVAWPAVGHTGKEPKKRVAVIEFENQAGISRDNYQDYKNLGSGMADVLVSRLLATHRFIVLDRLHLDDVFQEQELAEQGAVRPDVVSRLTSAQVLIRGIITHVETTKKEGAKVGLRKLGVKIGLDRIKTRIALIVQLIDVTTGQVLHAEMVETEVKKRSLSGRLRNRTADSEIDTGGSVSMGKVVEELMDQAIDGIVVGMQSVPWQGNVVKVSGRQVFINAGRDSNVEPGLELLVYERGEEMIDPDTNESLGRLDEEIGQIRVDKVGDRFAIGMVVEGEGFSRGNIVRPVPESDGDLGLTAAVGR